ncbi:MAG: SprT-like domain-containing protein [Firmicutes bacterium]|nr:SprT-like domain-containing protein [Bacillota bacterium]
MNAAELRRLAEALYRELAGRPLADVEVAWNPRLRTAAGRFVYPRGEGGGAPRIEINPRYTAAGGRAALVEVLKHELAHYHLWALGRPSGHTAEFHALARAWGFPRHASRDLLPPPAPRWRYVCPACGRAFLRVRRIVRPASCGACSPTFDLRFRLVEERLSVSRRASSTARQASSTARRASSTARRRR